MAVWTSELNNTSDALPTVTQWAKTVSAECAEATRIVKLIWCPNLYNSFSLDTEAYRVRIGENHPLYQVLQDNVEAWVEQGAVVAMQVIKGRKTSINLLTLGGEECDWDELGSHGYKAGPVRAVIKTVTAKTSNKRPAPSVPPAENAL